MDPFKSQQPQRWNIDANVAPHDAGQWVTWEDYCRLKKSLDIRSKLQSEGVERELKEWHRMWTEETDKVRRLEAEVERLRKAGDGLYQEFIDGYNIDTDSEIMTAWIVAKGKEVQS